MRIVKVFAFVVCVIGQASQSTASTLSTLFEFTGQSSQSFSTAFQDAEVRTAPTGLGSFVYRPLSEDLNPDPNYGDYTVLVERFVIEFAGDRLALHDVVAEAEVRDSRGCDCLLIRFAESGEFAGQEYDRFHVDIQDEAGRLWDDDSLPFEGLDLSLASTGVNFYSGTQLTVFVINGDSVNVVDIPEPGTLLLTLGLAGGLLVWRRRLR